MTHSQYEPLDPLELAPRAAAPPVANRRWPAVGVGVALLVLAMTASWASQEQIDGVLTQLDRDALDTGRRIFDRSLDEERAHVLSQVSVLAEDTRIRATVMMPNPDEGTIRDVLKDLMSSSGAGLLAVLDVSGKVKAVTGIEGLREIDLGSSSVVQAAVQRPAAYIWTFPQQVLAVGVAPIRSNDQVYAFLVMGFEAAKQSLVSIERSLGVLGAALNGEKIVAASTDDAALSQPLLAAGTIDRDRDMVIQGGGRSFLARVTRLGNSAVAAKLVWMVPHHHRSNTVRLLKLSIWTPSLAASLILLLLLVVSRRDGKAS